MSLGASALLLAVLVSAFHATVVLLVRLVHADRSRPAFLARPAGRSPIVLLVAIAAWIALYAAELVVPGEQLSVRLHQGVHVAIAMLPVATLSLALRLSIGTVRRSWIAAICVIPATSVVLNLLQSPTFWVAEGTALVGLLTPVLTAHGPWFWVHVSYAYLALASCLAVIGMRLRHHATRSDRQGLILLLAVVTPWVANAVSLFTGLSPHLDLTPLGCAVSAACLMRIADKSPSLSPRPAANALSLDTLDEGLLLVDGAGKLLDANAAALRMLAESRSASLDAQPAQLEPVWFPLLERLVRGGAEKRPLELPLPESNMTLQVVGGAVEDALAPDRLHSLLLRDVSRLRQAQANLRSLQGTDAVSGTSSRAAFMEELRAEVARSREPGAELGLIVVGLDDLRTINEIAGPGAGDSLLGRTGAELQRLSQEASGPEAKPKLVARLGSATFGVVVGPGISEVELLDLAGELVEAVATELPGRDRSLRSTARAGIARFPLDASDAASLVRAAEFARRSAREDGLPVAPYQRRLDMRAQRAATLTRDLVGAAHRAEMRLVYQPRLNLATGRPSRAEALLRWHHPALGEVSPAEFIPIAEASGSIAEVGAWALTRALEQLATWRAEKVPVDGLAINLAAPQLSDPGLFGLLTDSLRALSLDPSTIELEITETSLLRLGVDSATALRDLRAIGTQVFLDDFGTGYASLGYLNEITPDGVKIDRSFVTDVDRITNRRRICSALLALSRELGLRSVAEGVERSEELDVVRGLGCHEVQGFLYCAPISPNELAQFVK